MKRAIENESATAALAKFSVAIKLDPESRQFMLPLCFAPRYCMAIPDQQCSVYAICSDCIGGRKFPVRKMDCTIS